ncbi:leucine-rich repeat extensin-like protein 5 [Phragmites australis]|uniref:leucine-rich repeat extensin-like protein 5 n=1 Tax=Phragmites australis TaxID=29695 RepID=UPI002D78EEF9|nr:leucine-rich repeat extensin-like protein 5 [Phragmites australis]
MSSASGAGGRRITIRSISCRGVKSFIPFQKPPLYAVVSLVGRREKTRPDPDGGENPDWDGAVFAFDLDGDGQQQLVEFEVKAQVSLLGNKLVGTAGVPIAGLAAGGGAGDGAALRHVSYQVSAPDGKPNGTISFAYSITGGAGGVRPQPHLYPVPDGARPEQVPSFCCAPPPPPPPSAPYLSPATANFASHRGGYPQPPPPWAPVSASLYPPLHDLLPPSSYPPAPPPLPPQPMMTNPQFAAPNSSNYPPPKAPITSYPPATVSCTACPAPPAHYITSYPPQPPPLTNYPPPPPSGYPPPAFNLAPPTSTYPPPPESGSAYQPFPRSAPSPLPSTVDRAVPYYPAQQPSGGSYYPPPGTRHPELDGAARTPYYYPPPGTRYP